MEISDHDILVSYDVSALFTNVPVNETIGILARKAFKDDWFNNFSRSKPLKGSTNKKKETAETIM